MKKTVLAELEKKIRENIEYFYKKAYAAVGERVFAEKLTEEAVFHGAKRYGDLMNKARFFDIVEQKIGDGEFSGFEPCDLHALADRIIARVRGWNVRSTIGKWTCGILCTFAILAGGISLILPKVYEARSKNVILMENTAVIGGDFDNSELVNYQKISEELGLSSEDLNEIAGTVFLDRIASATTTPNGTTYVAVNNFNTFEAESTFTLHRAFADGWEAVGTADIGATLVYPPMNQWRPSEIYTFSDNESNVYVVSRLETEVTVHKYNIKTEIFEKTASIPFGSINYINNLYVEFDADYGESGTAYFICKEEAVLKVYRYDTATDTVSVIMENLELASEFCDINCCVNNDTVYTIITSKDLSVFYQIYGDGYTDSLRLCEYKESVISMEADKDGRIHVLVKHDELKQYIISESLLYVVDIVDRLYYQNTDYDRSGSNLFLGDDGELYYIESYYGGALGESNFFAVGRLDGEDPKKSTYVNGFDLPDSICWVRGEGENIMNFTNAHQDYEDTYIIYFHINMIDTED